MVHVINYYQNFGEGLEHYANHLKDYQKDLGYNYGIHYTPHDIGVHDFSIGRTRQDYALDYGLKLKRVDRISPESGIEAVRKILMYCVFDQVNCDEGLKAMEAYRKEWDEKKATYRNTPYHDWASNGADAFRTGGQVHKFTKMRFNRVGMGLEPKPAPSPKGWT